MLPTAEVAAGTYVDPDAEKNRGEYAGDLRRENMKLHCYVCKKYGHTKKDCPNKRCRFCFEIGHEREDCPVSGAPPTLALSPGLRRSILWVASLRSPQPSSESTAVANRSGRRSLSG